MKNLHPVMALALAAFIPPDPPSAPAPVLAAPKACKKRRAKRPDWHERGEQLVYHYPTKKGGELVCYLDFEAAERASGWEPAIPACADLWGAFTPSGKNVVGLLGDEVRQQITELALETVGADFDDYDPD